MTFPYQSLPKDMKLEIFSLLEPTKLSTVALLSKETNDLVKNDFIWKQKKIRFQSNKNSYYEKYKYSYGLEKVDKWLRQYMDFDNLLEITSISLHGRKIKEIPTELGHLHNLQVLFLDHNQLQEIPDELGNLTNLEGLYLNHNQLKEIPAELGNLPNLQKLYLYRNQLKKIPTELGNLSNLKELFVDINQLEGIPVELANLSNLERLYLDSNLSNEIPDAVKALNCEIVFNWGRKN